MDKEFLIHKVREALYESDHNSDPILVNFVDDEVFWDKIAKLAVEAVLEELDKQDS